VVSCKQTVLVESKDSKSTNGQVLFTGDNTTAIPSRDEVVLHQMACIGRLAATTATQQHHRLVTSCGQQAAIRCLSNGIDMWRHVLGATATEHLNHLQHRTVTISKRHQEKIHG